MQNIKEKIVMIEGVRKKKRERRKEGHRKQINEDDKKESKRELKNVTA